MAKTLAIQRILAQIHGNYANTSDKQIANTDFTFDYLDSLASGTAANQADLLWDDARQVGFGANDDIDMAGLTCVDIYGATLTFVELRGIMVINLETVSGEDLHIGGGGATEWLAWVGAAGDYVTLYSGGLFAYTAPNDGDLPLVAGVTDMLRITNAGASPIDYEIYLWGTSA